MRWPETLEPATMDRVAVVAPTDRLRAVLVTVAEAGVVQFEEISDRSRGPAVEAFDRARRGHPDRAPITAILRTQPPDLESLERAGELRVLAGEAELERVSSFALRRGSISALLGWAPKTARSDLSRKLASVGGALVALRRPRGIDPPTLTIGKGATGAFQPLVDTYATVGYRDLNPAALAGLAYVVMFGMMFGDVGHGALLLAGGLLLASGRITALERLRHLAPFVVGAGISSIVFGLLYGEMFGPTHAVPVVWLAPLDHATTLLAVAIAAGAGLLAISYCLGSVNRWREGGPARSLVATSGLAGAGLYLGIATIGLGWYIHETVLWVVGSVLALSGFLLGFVGVYGRAGGRASGAVQGAVEMFDAVVRIGTNTVSFARLAAFGLTHAALCQIVWNGTTSLWHHGVVTAVFGAVLFVVGNALAFCLEGLVAGVQAMRLEYYELFSRIFAEEGRKFRPWHVPVAPLQLSGLSHEEVPCSPG